MARHRPVRRRGFALLAVLWVMVGLAALALASQLAARDALAAAMYRTRATEARWRADGCAERSRAAIDEALGRRGAAEAVAGAWGALDSVVAEALESELASPLVTRGSGCDVTIVPTGIALDVNDMNGETLRRLLLALGADERADSLTDAMLDWRDADDVPRALGAERAWYRDHHRFPPRDGAFASTDELRRVRGVRDVAGVEKALTEAVTVEPGRVVLARAPATVLRALPGMTEESVARILDLQTRGERAIDLARFGALLSPTARDTMLAHYPELSRMVTPEPDAWILVARSTGPRTIDGPRDVAGVELRLVRAGTRAAVVRRRTW